MIIGNIPIDRGVSETMWDDDDQSQHNLRASAFPPFIMEQEELLLKRKAALLEEFLRNGGMEPRAVEDRIQILNERIASLEAELYQKGKLGAVHRYIEHAPQSDFDAINRDEFMKWFRSSQITTMRSMQTSQANTADQANRVRSFHAMNTSYNLAASSPDQFIDDRTHNSDVSSVVASSRRSKRARTAYNETIPCLRCKILKKRCDSLEQCGHCPEQSFESESDFWKVLGCLRGHLRGLSGIFCPIYSRSTQRVLRLPDGTTKTVHFVLTQSRVSAQRRRRILNLVHTRSAFAKLELSCWEDVSKRKTIGIAASSLKEVDEQGLPFDASPVNFEDYEACLAVLQVVSMDPVYLYPTRYNLFLLVRLGNLFSTLDPSSWEIFKEAKRLLRQAVELFLLERLCAHMASGDLVGPLPFYSASDPSSNTLVLVDIKNDLEDFLRNVEETCAGRGKLTGHPQLACLYALLVFGIAKSILIDAYSMRAEYEDEIAWKNTDAITINSAFKTLVSSFCWASKSDVLQAEFDSPGEYSPTLHTRTMVHQSEWTERGIKGTKEFLLSLGSNVPEENQYNGFLTQKFGLSNTTSPKPRATILERVSNPLNHDPTAQTHLSSQIQGANAQPDASLAHCEVTIPHHLNDRRADSDREDTLSVGESHVIEGSPTP